MQKVHWLNTARRTQRDRKIQEHAALTYKLSQDSQLSTPYPGLIPPGFNTEERALWVCSWAEFRWDDMGSLDRSSFLHGIGRGKHSHSIGEEVAPDYLDTPLDLGAVYGWLRAEQTEAGLR